MKLFAKIVAGIVGFVVIVTVVSLLPIWDDATITDSDLLLPAPAMPKVEQNGYTYLNKALPLTSAEQDLGSRASNLLSGDDIKTNQAATLGEAKAIVDGSKRLMPLFLLAAQQKTFVCPTEECSTNAYVQMYDIAAVNAYYASKQGDITKASELFTAMMQFGYAFTVQETKNQGMLFYLVGQRFLNRAVTLAALPGIHSLPTMSMFKNYILPSDMFTVVNKRIYMDNKALIEKGFENNHQNNYWLLPNRTINTLAQFARESIDIQGNDCSKIADAAKADELNQRVMSLRPSSFSTLFSPNLKGKVLLSVILASNAPLKTKMCEYNAQVIQLSAK